MTNLVPSEWMNLYFEITLNVKPPRLGIYAWKICWLLGQIMLVLSIYLSIYLYMYMCIYIYIYISVCNSIWFLELVLLWQRLIAPHFCLTHSLFPPVLELSASPRVVRLSCERFRSSMSSTHLSVWALKLSLFWSMLFEYWLYILSYALFTTSKAWLLLW